MNIGIIIRDRRKELGLTLEELGDLVGVGKSTVRKWETGYISNMKRDKIALVAKALKLNPVSLIIGEKIEENENIKEKVPAEAETKENHIIDMYSRLTPQNQAVLDTLLESMLEQQDKDN